ncbi:MAG TPA: RNA polymerase sigma factor [Opitutaceae bacterium]|nr:RNA polymerase sigma factor [Opitutaceae bacterium]
MPPLDSETNRWFTEEVLPLETILRAYLRRKFPTLTDVDDVVQESYLKIVKARLEGRLYSARGFLFTAARNVALDVFRRRPGNRSVANLDETPVLLNEEGAGVAERVCRDQELALLGAAIESLPLRCRQVFKLRKIYGLSHREIAAQLGISERTVNVQVGHGVRRCADYLEAHGVVLMRSKNDQRELHETA